MLTRRYDLLESEKDVARWFAEQYRARALPDNFLLLFTNQNLGCIVVGYSGEFRAEAPSSATELAIQSLIREGLLHKLPKGGLYGFRQALLDAVDTDFGRKVGGGAELVLTDDVMRLADQVAEYFNLHELEDLAFQMGIELDMVGGANYRSAKARELVMYFVRRGRLNEFIKKLEELRAEAAWFHP